MNRFLMASVAALGLCSIAASAAAKTTVIYTGTVTSDSEADGNGGKSKNVFVGDLATLTFTIDPSAVNPFPISPGIVNSFGGTAYGTVSPIDMVSYSVQNGPSGAVSGAYSGAQLNESLAAGLGVGVQSSSVTTESDDGINRVTASISAELNGPLVPQFGDYNGPTSSSFFSLLVSTTNDATGHQSFELLEGTVSSIATVASAVPEPSTWAMMLLGFGAIGGAAWARKGARFAGRLKIPTRRIAAS